MTIRQGESDASSSTLSSISTHTSSVELVEHEGLHEIEIPMAEICDEPMQSSRPMEVDYTIGDTAETIEKPIVVDEWAEEALSLKEQKRKRKGKKGKGSLAFESSASPPEPKPVLRSDDEILP